MSAFRIITAQETPNGTKEKPVLVTCHATNHPGLFIVTRSIVNPVRWTVSHVKSTRRIIDHIRTVDEAIQIADELAEIPGWHEFDPDNDRAGVLAFLALHQDKIRAIASTHSTAVY